MTDIYIKSFNRAFYLDRCLHSIRKFVVGNFRITVLEDGTPQKYLEKIRSQYPDVKIILSENYQKKQEAISENLKSGTEINGFEIPTKLWFNAASGASDYLIMTEDDVWFTEKINLDDLVAEMKSEEISLTKLGWLGNASDDKNLEISNLTDKLNRVVPIELFLSNESVMKAFFYNQFKFYSLLYKLGKVDNTTRRKYWALNSILMGLYKKDYWLQIWKGMEGKVDEKRQLINASVYYKKHRNNKNFLARLKKEAMKTTFQSSATNSYHQYGNRFDVNLFNHIINEAWFDSRFDPLQNFPKDFDEDYFAEFMDERINTTEMKNWMSNFKKHYREIGCDVDN